MSEKKQNFLPLRDRIMRETRAMVEHAQANGKHIPPAVSQMLEKLELQKALQYDPDNMELNMRAANYAAMGVETEADIMAQLTMAHNTMSGIVAPATPESVLLLKKERDSAGWLKAFGRVGMVRQMSFITLVCILLFLGLFMSDLVDSASINGNILDYAWDKFLLNQLFLLSMAAMGAGFYNLFEAYKYLTEGTFDTKYTSVYWIRFTLGIVSGIMLSQFIFNTGTLETNTANDTMNAAQTAGVNIFFKPLLAFLGGFSARVVYRVLSRLVEALETFIDGSAKDILDAREEMARMKLDQALSKAQQGFMDQSSIEKMTATIKLMELKEQLASGTIGQPEVKKIIDQMVKESVDGVNASIEKPKSNAPASNWVLPDVPVQPVAPVSVQPVQPINPVANSSINPADFDVKLPDIEDMPDFPDMNK